MFRLHRRRNAKSVAQPGAADVPQARQIHTHVSGRYWWMWDEPQRRLSVGQREGDQWTTAFVLPMECLAVFRSALDRFSHSQVEALVSALEEIAQELRRWHELPNWDDAFYDVVGLLLLDLIALKEAQYGAPALHGAAFNVAARLPPESARGAWRVAYQTKLKHASRAGILGGTDAALMRDPELVWWTARCRIENAMRWFRSEVTASVDAVHEVTDSVNRYIHLLRLPSSRRALESFYAAMNTNSEDEVLRVLEYRDVLPVVPDRLRAEITLWLLRRYALGKAARLLSGTLSRAEKVAGWVSLFLLEGAVACFFTHQVVLQVSLQLLAFFAFAFVAPRILALFLPRALFGTLLAWLTVVLAQTASLLPIVSDDRAVHSACHLWLFRVMHPGSDPRPFIEFVALLGIGVAVSITFLKLEVHNRLATEAGLRSTGCFFVMLFGSLFWGAMLVPTLQYILAREPLGSPCACVFPAWVMGSVCAVAFGILVQLMWDDHAVADALGLPGESARA